MIHHDDADKYKLFSFSKEAPFLEWDAVIHGIEVAPLLYMLREGRDLMGDGAFLDVSPYRLDNVYDTPYTSANFPHEKIEWLCNVSLVLRYTKGTRLSLIDERLPSTTPDHILLINKSHARKFGIGVSFVLRHAPAIIRMHDLPTYCHDTKIVVEVEFPYIDPKDVEMGLSLLSSWGAE